MMPESCSLNLDIIVGSAPKKIKNLMGRHRYSEEMITQLKEMRRKGKNRVKH